ncbi:MAG: serine hydrolase domain-containing protein [Bacteroidales bacterium]|nr:serine hydrolase domain-containing protein [Bacteroidales bacterium]
MKSIIFTLLLALMTAGAAQAKDMKKELNQQLGALFSEVFHDDEPGAAIVLVKDGKKIYEQCFGWADKDTKAPITPNTNFCIASVSKQFAAVALLQLAEQGKLSLTDPLSKYFPEFKAPFFGDITLHHILSHTSGIPDARDRSDRHFVLTATDVASVGYMKSLDRLNFTPGDGHYEYINPTYQLCYQIVEKVSGMPFEKYMKKYIFDPAGMKRTQYFDASRTMENAAHGYDWDAATKSWKEYDYGEESFFATKADGGIYTSINEFIKWESALRFNVVMKPLSRVKAYKPWVQIPADAEYGYQPNTGYGYGFFIQETPGRYPIVYHTGDNGGFTIYAGKIPATDMVLLMFSTRPNIDRMAIINRTYDIIEHLCPSWLSPGK